MPGDAGGVEDTSYLVEIGLELIFSGAVDCGGSYIEIARFGSQVDISDLFSVGHTVMIEVGHQLVMIWRRSCFCCSRVCGWMKYWLGRDVDQLFSIGM